MPQIATSLPYASILQDVTDAQRPNVLSGVVVPAESAFGWCTGTVEERILSVLTAFHCNPQGKDAQLNSNSTISRPDQPVGIPSRCPAHQMCVPIWFSRLLLGVSIFDLLRALDTVTITTRKSTKVFTCQKRARKDPMSFCELQRGEPFLLGSQ